MNYSSLFWYLSRCTMIWKYLTCVLKMSIHISAKFCWNITVKYRFTWIAVIYFFAIDLPSRLFLGHHLGYHLFHNIHWGLHTFLQLGHFELDCFFLTVQCPLLTDQNGIITCSLGDDEAPSYEDTCNFTCNTGYELTGSDTRTCQSDGSWSGNDKICKKGEFVIKYVALG